MATNLVRLRTTEEFMNDYVSRYQPLYPLFMGNSQQFSLEVGKVNFTRLSAKGDIRQRHILPKDTEIFQFSAREGSKVFKKYFKANQFTVSGLQSREGVEGVMAEALDEHQKQADDLLLLGEGTAANNVINNGLYWSGDENYVLNSSEELSNAPDTQNDLYDLLQTNIAAADEVPGKKAIIFYGASVLGKLPSFYPETVTSVRQTIDESLSGDYSIVKMPTAVTPAASNGWIIANLDQVKLDYVLMPELHDQGVNAEKMYAWFNFLMGSMMLEVQAAGAVIRQPVTFEA